MWEAGLEGHESTGLHPHSPHFFFLAHPPPPFSRSSVFPKSFNLRYFVTVCCGVVQLYAASESTPQSHEYPCLCSLKGSTSCSTYSTSSAEWVVLPSEGQASWRANISHKTSECADYQAWVLAFAPLTHNSSVMIGNCIQNDFLLFDLERNQRCLILQPPIWIWFTFTDWRLSVMIKYKRTEDDYK